MKDVAEASTLAAEAYSVVRQRILRGELVLGQAISRRKLAAELGMSFLPVSEALLRLEFEGLLESRPRAVTRVRIPSREDVRGHYVVREALEVQAAMLFARVATASERAELRRLAARVDAVSLQPDRTLYVVLHQKLHHRIAECTRCPALCDAIEKTHALASTWFPASRGSRRRTIRRGGIGRWSRRSPAANRCRPPKAMRQHIAVGIQHARAIGAIAPAADGQRGNVLPERQATGTARASGVAAALNCAISE